MIELPWPREKSTLAVVPLDTYQRRVSKKLDQFFCSAGLVPSARSLNWALAPKTDNDPTVSFKSRARLCLFIFVMGLSKNLADLIIARLPFR
jgi:hypothetical protein